jgi:hypothetical protein
MEENEIMNQECALYNYHQPNLVKSEMVATSKEGGK